MPDKNKAALGAGHVWEVQSQIWACLKAWGTEEIEELLGGVNQKAPEEGVERTPLLCDEEAEPVSEAFAHPGQKPKWRLQG